MTSVKIALAAIAVLSTAATAATLAPFEPGDWEVTTKAHFEFSAGIPRRSLPGCSRHRPPRRRSGITA